MEYEKLLNAVVRDLKEDKERVSQGRTSLGRGCAEYTDDCKQRLIEYAENGKECLSKCEYCSKFKWVIDRAKHYGEKLGIPWKEVMQSWDEDMSYWYMNYYQECNQPRIEGNNVFVFESAEEMREKVGTEFICPCCKGISTNPYECNSGIIIKGSGVCDWKSYGLIQLNLAFIYCKKERKSTKCFMPKALIHQTKKEG